MNGKSSRKVSCYMCDNPPTTMEHVPPKCFFPESKDVFDGKDYRKNLISVPSCEDHNLKKSHDDEYIFYVVLSNYSGNLVAFNQFVSKALRAYRKNPKLLGIYSSTCPATVNQVKTKAFQVDLKRIANINQLDNPTRTKANHQSGTNPSV